jgi:hypothetical protein
MQSGKPPRLLLAKQAKGITSTGGEMLRILKIGNGNGKEEHHP